MDPFGMASSISQFGANLLNSIESMLSFRDRFDRKSTKGETPASPVEHLTPEVRSAASDFLGANLRLLATVQSIQRMGLPPSVVGALWSWPYVVSATRSVPDLGNEAMIKLGQLTMLSDSEILNSAAVDAAIAVGDALRRFPNKSRRPEEDDVRTFIQASEAAMNACGRMVAVVKTGELPSVESPAELPEGEADLDELPT